MAIGVLSPKLASRIAAGEVIERPASVAKELIENSLDAGATRIRLEVADGGARLVSVTDNGHGIARGEMALAFERFATSKIDESSDLSGIATLGFRGEALPSIASVARVEAVSRVDGSDSGTRLVIDNGQLIAEQPAAGPPGTRIEVKGLFEKVPARRKFLGSAGRELTRIRQLISTYAVVYPSVAFSFASDGSSRFATPGSGDVRAAVAAAYGARLADAMLEIDDNGSGAFGVSGLISEPGTSRGTRRYVTLAVNARWIENRRLSFAVDQGYHGFLPERRFPVAVLSIRTPLDDVDVNVHPAKLEVRLLREDLVFREIQRVIRLALGDFAPVRTMNFPGRPNHSGQGMPVANANNPFGAVAMWPSRSITPPQQPESSQPCAPVEHPESPESAPGPAPAPMSQRSVLPILRVIGQARETYILAEGPDGLYLVDQHAAHERVLYEEIKERTREKSAESQPLLMPESIELDPRQMEAVQLHGQELQNAGFHAEPFGESSVILRAIPAMMANGNQSQTPGAVFGAILDEINEGRGSDSWQDRLLYTMACHAAIKAGMPLTTDESRELIRRLEQAEQPHTCPHGRPTMIHLDAGALEYQFGRR